MHVCIYLASRTGLFFNSSKTRPVDAPRFDLKISENAAAIEQAVQCSIRPKSAPHSVILTHVLCII